MIDAKIIDWLKDDDLQSFIHENRFEKPHRLALKLSKSELPRDFIISQIKGIQQFQKKAPFLIDHPLIVFPQKTNIEQSSSFHTAEYKSNLLNGTSMVDLTGGFGIDTYHFTKSFEIVHYVEPNDKLLNLVKWNFNQLGIHNVTYHNQSAEEFLKSNNQQFDLIYVDPSRRDESNNKKYKLSDCSPNLTILHIDIIERCTNFMYKVSPIFDLRQSLKELNNVQDIHVISVENECKELLLLGGKYQTNDPSVKAVHKKDNQLDIDAFYLSELNDALVDNTNPKEFVYFFNPSIMKSAGQNMLAQKLGLSKIANNSNIFTADKRIDKFHGRILQVLKYGDYDSKKLGLTKGESFRIMIKNFPYSVDQIQKKLKIKEGGNRYLVATTSEENKPLIIIGTQLNT